MQEPAPSAEKPILAVDIDGVISLFGWEGPATEAPGRWTLVDGIAHCISHEAGNRLQRLLPHYEMIWASGWEDRANDHLPPLLGLPPLPYLTFGGKARFGTAHWKVPVLDAFCSGRALAWIDDSLDPSCFEWAERRADPTKLIPTLSQIGITDEHVSELVDWAATLASPHG